MEGLSGGNSDDMAGKRAVQTLVVPVVAKGTNGSVSPAKRAADILKSGGVIAVPTDTIYGIAALVQSAAAVKKLYDIKGRDDAKPISICVADVADVGAWGEVGEALAASPGGGVLGDLLPGPVTVLLRRRERLNADFNPATRLVGIRIPDHAFIREVCRLCAGSPLALTSANLSNQPSTLAVEEFEGLFPRLDAVFDGGRISAETDEARLGSTIVDLSAAGVYSVNRAGCALARTREVMEKHGIKEAP